MQPTVYIETSIPSYYFETRTDPKAIVWRTKTRTWLDQYAREYRLVSSRVVLDELRLAPGEKASSMLALMQPIRLLEEPPDIDKIVEHYVKHRLVPANVLGDAYHLAFASMHRVRLPVDVELPPPGQCE